MSGKAETPRNPYVGPRAFEIGERKYFYGRDEESAILEGLVMTRRASVLFAQSGAGKSSLVKAGLIPRLTEQKSIGRGRLATTYQKMRVMPVASVGGAIPERVTEKIDNLFIFSVLYSIDPECEPAGLVQKSLSEGLAPYFEEKEHETPEATNTLPAPTSNSLLIFDQFEELFTHHLHLRGQREKFFRQVAEALDAYGQLHVLFTMREDYIAELTPYAHLLPDQLRERFRLERLKREAALIAVREPAATAGRTYDDGVAEALVDDLRRVQASRRRRPAGEPDDKPTFGVYVEPVQLQIVCRQLWSKLPAERQRITMADKNELGDPDEALTDFYEETLTEAINETGVKPRQIRNWFDSELITPARTRGLVYRGEHDSEGLPNEAAEILNEAYIIRASVRGSDVWYELAHDRLVEPILTANAEWREQDQSPLARAAADWLEADRAPRRLLTGAILDQARAEVDAAPDDFSKLVQEFVTAGVKNERQRRDVLETHRMVDLEYQKYLSETGWGVIFAHDADPAVREALAPLLKHRKAKATMKRKSYYQEFSDGRGRRSGESARDFLTRHGMGVGRLNYSLMPYYLLIVGDPESIPWEFQYQLGVNYAVGRIAFDTVEEYGQYAASVVKAETGKRVRSNELTVFNPVNPDDSAGELFDTLLADPLVERLIDERPEWLINAVSGEEATKARLRNVLGGSGTPAIFLSGSHGLFFPIGDKRQRDEQGAILCQDWPGPRQWRGSIPEEFYFSAADLDPKADLHGLVAFFFAEYAAGTPEVDDFAMVSFREPAPIAPKAFVARLPQRLLSHPMGGALAVIAHVERAWVYSFYWGKGFRQGEEKKPDQTGIDTFNSIIGRLMDGFPVGSAIKAFKIRYAELATLLATEFGEKEVGKQVEDYQLAGLWAATIDARNWIVLGDPATKAMIEGATPDEKILDQIYTTERLLDAASSAAKRLDIKQAIESYEEALTLTPWLELDPQEEANRLAVRRCIKESRLRAGAGDVAGAIELIELFLKLEPTLQEQAIAALIESGDEVAGTGDFPGARTLYQKAKQVSPDLDMDPEEKARVGVSAALVEQGRGLARKGDVAGARDRFREALDLNPQLDLDPGAELRQLAAPALMLAAEQHEALGDRQKAGELFESATALNPKLSTGANQIREAYDHIAEGRRQVGPGTMRFAVRELDAALERYPKIDLDPETVAGKLGETAADFIVKMARQRVAEDNNEAAERLFNRARRYNPRLKLDLGQKAGRPGTPHF